MHRELPLYVFVRNAIVLCFVFFMVSGIIIEKGRQERGEESLFNGIGIKHKKIIDYNDHDIINSINADPINAYKDNSEDENSIFETINKVEISAITAGGKNKNPDNTNQGKL